MIRLVLKWLAVQFGAGERVPYGVQQRHLGELYRADAKAQGQRVVLAGWEVADGCDTTQARWYSLELTRDDIPWAYARGDPFRSIASLELLATLLCVLVFEPRHGCATRGTLSLTASGDNRSNGFTLDRMSTTKFPLYLVLMEVAAQLRDRNLVLGVAWRPRDENEEADALTNGNFAAFNASRRVAVEWPSLRLLVLPRLVAAALELFAELQEAKRAQRQKASGPQPKRARLRERDPW